MWNIGKRKARCDSVIYIECMCISEVQLGDSPYIKELEGKKRKPSDVMFCIKYGTSKTRKS